MGEVNARARELRATTRALTLLRPEPSPTIRTVRPHGRPAPPPTRGRAPTHARAMARPDQPPKDEKQSIARNKRARHDYEILDTWEAGIVLTGTEVKSLRDGKANLADSYAVVNDGEVYLLNLHISPYEQGNQFNHEPTRTRKLLLHRKEIRRMIGSVERQGLTLIAMELYFKRGKAKVAIGLGKGKKQHDKREDLKKRDADRELARIARAR
jgi:SsrA-binding protein